MQRALGDRQNLPVTLNRLAWLAMHTGDRGEAGERFDEARRIATETQSRPALTDALRGLRELAQPATHGSPTA